MKYYAEFGTDKFIIENYFPGKTDGIMVEVGAALPEEISTSKAFHDLGWRCINIEPNPSYAEAHRKAGNEIHQLALSNKPGEDLEFNIYTSPDKVHHGMSYSCLKGKGTPKPIPPTWVPWIQTIKVKVITFNQLLESLNVDKLDFVSIDVEGWEIEVMKGFDVNKYNPKVILLENLDNLSHIPRYMQSIGFKKVHALQQNEIYMRDE